MRAQLVATGNLWIGNGVRSYSAMFDELLTKAGTRVCLTAYSLTDRKVMESLMDVLERGLELEIFITDPADGRKNPFSERLQILEGRYGCMRVHYMDGLTLHAKVAVVDYRWILLGSANLSFSGLTNNYELGVLLEDPTMAMNIEDMLARLVK